MVTPACGDPGVCIVLQATATKTLRQDSSKLYVPGLMLSLCFSCLINHSSKKIPVDPLISARDIGKVL